MKRAALLLILALLLAGGAGWLALSPAADDVQTAETADEASTQTAAKEPPESASDTRGRSDPRTVDPQRAQASAQESARERLHRLRRLRKEFEERVAEEETPELRRPPVVKREVRPEPAPRPIPQPVLRNGAVVERYPDGRLKLEGYLLDGKRHGLWTEYHQDGGRSQTEYDGGTKHGQEGAWNADGKVRYLGEYDRGEMAGEWMSWHRNGNVHTRRGYAGGQVHGGLQTFHESGVLAEDQMFHEGAEIGLNRGYHDNGVLHWEMTYVDGMRQGHATWYDADGRLTGEGDYADDKLHGEYIAYNADGTVERRETWDTGRIVANPR